MRSCCIIIFLFIVFCRITSSPATAGLKENHRFTGTLSTYTNVNPNSFSISDSSQETPAQKPQEINYGRLAVMGGLLTGAMVTIHIYQQNGWWRDNRSPFHFQEDLVYGLSVDKIGHFYGASLLTFVFRNALETANMPERKSLYIGAAGALLFQTYVEVEDGFSKWGFDRVDFASDVGGVLWPILQYEYPALANYDLKFSYIPSPLVDKPGSPSFKGQKHTMIDDYEGQTFWLSAKMRNILPAPIVSYWPSFLCLAIGYGARNIDAIEAPWPNRVVFLSIDYDFTKIIPDSTPLLRGVGKALNFIHFPAPAVQISPTAIWYGLYF
jgi:hypothetical protein